MLVHCQNRHNRIRYDNSDMDGNPLVGCPLCALWDDYKILHKETEKLRDTVTRLRTNV